MIFLCLLMIPVGLLVCWPMARMAVAWSDKLGLMDRPGSEPHKPVKSPVPNVGGVAVFWAVAMPVAAVVGAVWAVPVETWQRFAPAAVDHLPGLRATTVVGGGLLGAMAALHVLGLIDDRKPLPAVLKLGAMIGVAVGLVMFGNTRVLELLDAYGPFGHAASVTLSVLWIVAMVNAFNMLDNMDGLSAGVGAVVAGVYLAATLINGQWFVAAVSALMLGALLGFLWFNRPPARLYLGDGGALVVGLVLAVVSIRTTYFDPQGTLEPLLPGLPTVSPTPGGVSSGGGGVGAWWGVLMPLVVMAVPIYDLVSVSIIRLRAGRSPLSGDHNHFSHRLVRLGLSRGSAVAVIVLATAATGLSGVMLPRLSGWQAVLALAQTAAVVATLGVLEFAGAKGRRGRT